MKSLLTHRTRDPQELRVLKDLQAFELVRIVKASTNRGHSPSAETQTGNTRWLHLSHVASEDSSYSDNKHFYISNLCISYPTCLKHSLQDFSIPDVGCKVLFISTICKFFVCLCLAFFFKSTKVKLLLWKCFSL